MDRLKIIGCGNNNIKKSGGSIRSGNGYWTNERHLDFLSLMETSFVRNVLENKRSTNAHHHLRHAAGRLVHRQKYSKNMNNNKNHNNLRLDRFVPDISESTLDLQQTRKKNSGSVHVSDPVHRSRSRQRERRLAHPYKTSHDQVVPQIEDKAGDKDEEDHNH